MSLPGDLDELFASEMSISLPGENEEEEEEEEEEPERSLVVVRESNTLSIVGHERLQEGPPSPAPSYESMKSDEAYDYNLSDFDEEPPPTYTRIHLERPDSPASSCSSMDSDDSRECSPKPFWMGPRQRTKTSDAQPEDASHTPPRVQLSKAEVQALLGVTERRHPAMNVQFMFKTLQTTLEKLSEYELRYFKKCLVERYPQCFESTLMSHDILELVDKMLEVCDMEGSQQITVLILTDMKLKEVVKYLQFTVKKNEARYDLKANLKRKYTYIYEGVANQGSSALFNSIFTELFITMGGNAGINTEHEVMEIGPLVKKRSKEVTVLKCSDLFNLSAGHQKHQRSLLMKGMAGMGKTTCVQKFILDWAEGRDHQDIYFVFPLPFEDLNVIEGVRYSLIQLLHYFFPETKELETIESDDDCQVLIICDGLDECRLPLNFQKNECWCDVTMPTTLDVLLTNLFRGNLLTSGYTWVTSRPSAASRLPPDCVHQLVEVRGFKDPEKEEYFRKRFSDQDLADKIITHIKSSRSLDIMCHIPMFCWTASDMLGRAYREAGNEEINTTLTQMFTHFLLVQLDTKVRRYYGKELSHMHEPEREFLTKLGKLAFRQLEKGQMITNEEEWRESGLNLKETVVHSGLCTELFKEVYVMYHEKVYCFMHLSIQEYLAALYVILSFKNNSRNVLDQPLRTKVSRLFKETSMFDLHKSAVDQALQSQNGHLDLFLRFLLGLSLHSNQGLLRGIILETGSGTQNFEKTAQYIRKKMKECHSAERCNNLARCLDELQL
ncbi:protein NLRC3-like [Megalops cyprinoides]|uniref:protein NLRC3-like n=1 Tax=Megalops cyprinoides TaxID=118141 RepID=UPI0018640C3F|nr:protein NLRC3-like [Megalops cyprinoides]